MRTVDPARDEPGHRRSNQPRTGYVLASLCLLAMLGISVVAWPDMVDHLPQEQSRRTMLFEPHKALGNAIAPVTLLIVMSVMSLAPDLNRRFDRFTRLRPVGPGERRRMLDVALTLTGVTLLAVHGALVWAYLGHQLDPVRLTAWCLIARPRATSTRAPLALAVFPRISTTSPP